LTPEAQVESLVQPVEAETEQPDQAIEAEHIDESTSLDELFTLRPEEFIVPLDEDEDDDDDQDGKDQKKGKKKKKRFVEVEYDPDRDITIVKRKRKRGGDDWEY
jgi:hypothetical protein